MISNIFFYLYQIFFDLQLCYFTGGGRPVDYLINSRGYLKKPTEINGDFSLQRERRKKAINNSGCKILSSGNMDLKYVTKKSKLQ